MAGNSNDIKKIVLEDNSESLTVERGGVRVIFNQEGTISVSFLNSRLGVQVHIDDPADDRRLFTNKSFTITPGDHGITYR